MKAVNKKLTTTLTSLLIFGLISCHSAPEPIHLGQDACSFCKMSIANNHFGAEIKTKKGKVYKFDDMHCIAGFIKLNEVASSEIWLVNYAEPHNFIPAQKAFLLKSPELHSPMGANIANFDDESKLKDAMKNMKGEELTWNQFISEK